MRVGSLLAGVIASVGVGLIVEAKSNVKTVSEARRDVVAAPDLRERLAQSLATIQSAYEDTRKSGKVERRQLWQVGEALPGATCQPSCRRHASN